MHARGLRIARYVTTDYIILNFWATGIPARVNYFSTGAPLSHVTNSALARPEVGKTEIARGRKLIVVYLPYGTLKYIVYKRCLPWQHRRIKCL